MEIEKKSARKSNEMTARKDPEKKPMKTDKKKENEPLSPKS